MSSIQVKIHRGKKLAIYSSERPSLVPSYATLLIDQPQTIVRLQILLKISTVLTSLTRN